MGNRNKTSAKIQEKVEPTSFMRALAGIGLAVITGAAGGVAQGLMTPTNIPKSPPPQVVIIREFAVREQQTFVEQFACKETPSAAPPSGKFLIKIFGYKNIQRTVTLPLSGTTDILLKSDWMDRGNLSAPTFVDKEYVKMEVQTSTFDPMITGYVDRNKIKSYLSNYEKMSKKEMVTLEKMTRFQILPKSLSK